jgi:Tfp pilus assembly protein FimT
MDGRRRGLSERGITVVELVTAVGVVATLAAMAVPRFLDMLLAYRLRTTAWQVAAVLYQSRQSAVTSLRRHLFVFETAEAGAAGGTYHLEVEEGAGRTSGPVGARSLPEGVAIDAASTPRTRAIPFDPRGTVTPAGTIRLRSRAGGYEVAISSQGRVAVHKCGTKGHRCPWLTPGP